MSQRFPYFMTRLYKTKRTLRWFLCVIGPGLGRYRRRVAESSDEIPSVEENLGGIEAGTYVCKHQVYFGKVEKG